MLSIFKIGSAINKHGDRGIRWVSHGMLRIEVSVMKRLFEKPLARIIEVGLFFSFHYLFSTILRMVLFV